MPHPTHAQRQTKLNRFWLCLHEYESAKLTLARAELALAKATIEANRYFNLDIEAVKGDRLAPTV